MSKDYGIAGFRIGYLETTNSIIHQLKAKYGTWALNNMAVKLLELMSNNDFLVNYEKARKQYLHDKKIFFIDWEYSGYNEFYYDIASFGNLDFRHALVLLDNYLGRESTPEEKNHLRFYRIYQTLQWHQVALYKNKIGLGEKIGVDFKSLAINFLKIAESLSEYLFEL